MARQRRTGTLTDQVFTSIVDDVYQQSWQRFLRDGDLAPALVAVDDRGSLTTLPITGPEDFLPSSAAAHQRLADVAAVAVVFAGQLFYLRRPELVSEPDQTPDGPRAPLDRVDIIVTVGAWPRAGTALCRCAEIVAYDGCQNLLDVDAPRVVVDDLSQMLVALLEQRPAAA